MKKEETRYLKWYHKNGYVASISPPHIAVPSTPPIFEQEYIIPSSL